MGAVNTMTGRARKTDPATSHLAAEEVGPVVATVRSRVEAIFAVPGLGDEGLTHDQLIGAYRRYALREGWPAASDSSIRTRCNELWREGLVERVPDRSARSRFGRAALLWRAADVQNKKTSDDMGETA